MNNVVLILVIVLGLAAGYFVGDYRGKEARAALEHSVETGRVLETELQSSLANLKDKLAKIDSAHNEALEKSRKEYEARYGEWKDTKKQLDGKIDKLNRNIADSEANLAMLKMQLKSASPEERARLALEIERLEGERDELRKSLEGNICLKKAVPQNVLAEINRQDVAKE